ncbi:hypothetical protein ACFDR9_003787 [Janthinobacterium sp. CG_23.3]|uniref:hypothetical protein n=1 Tax=Janthinobacterium sp. CG_23.3 TaxID=3349634 RepID=UPI0038D4C1B8
MNRSTLLAALLTTTLCGAALAEPVPPPDWKPDPMQAVALPVKPATRLALGRFTVSLAKTTLKQVRDALGAGKIEESAGDGRSWLCYTVQTGAAPERLWLVADGALGGPEHRVTLLHALQLPALLPSPRCPLLPRRFLPARFNKDLWLKQPSLKVTQAFGQPSVNADARWSYAHTAKTTTAGKDGAPQLEVSNRVEAQIRDGAISAIIATQTSVE